MFGGGNNPFKTTREVLMGHTYLKDQQALHDVARRAFEKCVTRESLFSPESSAVLDEGQLTCVEEYVTQYTMFAERAFTQFAAGYDKMAREAMVKMRRMEEQHRAREEAQRMRGTQ